MRKSLKFALNSAGKWLVRPQRLNQLVFLAASASLAYGLYLINEPAAFIGMGALFIFLATWEKGAE